MVTVRLSVVHPRSIVRLSANSNLPCRHMSSVMLVPRFDQSPSPKTKTKPRSITMLSNSEEQHRKDFDKGGNKHKKSRSIARMGAQANRITGGFDECES